MTRFPAISVVIASIVGPPFIDDCIASVLAQKNAPPFEVIVVDCRGPENVARLRARFPQAQFVEVPQRESVPQLRALGVQHAQGEIVAIIEEHCLAAEQWLATVSAAFSPEYVAVGGPVDFRSDGRLRDWITYFIEYNSYLPPWSDGDSYNVGSANAAYRRQTLEANRELLTEGYWEAALHPKLLAEGARFRSVPGMIAYHRGPFDYLYYVRQRYLFSRAFAGARRNTDLCSEACGLSSGRAGGAICPPGADGVARLRQALPSRQIPVELASAGAGHDQLRLRGVDGLCLRSRQCADRSGIGSGSGL